MENEIQVFEQANITVFKQLSELKKQMEELKKQEETLKDNLQKQMEVYGIKSVKNEYVTISYVDASSSTSIDLKSLEKKEPELYKELLEDYQKVINRKAYVKFVVK